MEVTGKIRRSFADEHVLAVDPPLRPDVSGVWRRRIHAFAGRAVSDRALTAEQDVRSGLQRLRGLGLAPGTVEGLQIFLDRKAIGAAAEAAYFELGAGLGITRSGEDVTLPAGRRLAFGALPVILRADQADALAGGKAPPPLPAPGVGGSESDGDGAGMAARLRPALPRGMGPVLADIAANKAGAGLARVAVLLAQPVTATISGRAPDPCGPDPRDDPYADLRRVDGCRLALYLWPSEMAAIGDGPDYSMPPDDDALRNRLAYRVFDNEKIQMAGEMHPWEEWGLPLGLVAFDDGWKLRFVDRAAVARIGGTHRGAGAPVPLSGEPRLWQARIDQFVGQLIDMKDLDEASLRTAFLRLPPVGLLPKAMFDPLLRRQHFFPGSYAVSAVPIPRSNVELAVREAAPLASFNRGAPDLVDLLVPVPDSAYDPRLLQTEVEDPRFVQAIKAARADRAGWLVRREAARRRYDRLLESVSGIAVGWPDRDLPLDEISPPPRTATPVDVTRTRRFDEQSASRTHAIMGAHASLPVAAGDTLWFWVRIHSNAQMTGLALRVGRGTGTAPDKGDVYGGVYWGAPDVTPLAGDTGARKMGELPEAGVWQRLEIPASNAWMADGGGLDGFAINAVEFTQRGGQVEWGSFGKRDATGMTYTYIADDAPAGAALSVSGQKDAGWPWAPVAGREDVAVPAFGTIEDKGVRRAGALDDFRAQWTQPFLADELARVDDDGLAAFCQHVDARLKATNDAIDLGFVRARADIYRVRQIMLGADAASRLVTSPSLADLAVRDEGARATAKGIADFLLDAKARDTKPVPPAPAAPPVFAVPAPPPRVAAPSRVFQPQFMTLNMTGPSVLRPISQPAPPARTLVRTPLIATAVQTQAVLPGVRSLPLTVMPAILPATIVRPVQAPALSVNASQLALDRFGRRDIQAQLPIAGLVERTVSVAERLTPSAAVQALNYAIASKAAILDTLGRLSGADGGRPAGVALGDLLVPGFQKRGAAAGDTTLPTLAQLLEDRAKPISAQVWIDADQIPDQQDKHESDYFTNAVQAIDNSIALMRLVEGRVALFDQLGQSLRDLRAAIDASADEAAAWLRQVAVELEEARHDLATAERLRAEEDARVAAVNARRAAILDSQVDAIVWRRVRTAGTARPGPTMEVASGLAVDPVVACRREHPDVPDEILDYVELLREAPAKWFPAVDAAVLRVERLEAARAAIAHIVERAGRGIVQPRTLRLQVTPKLLRGVQTAMGGQHQHIAEQRAAVAQVNLAGLAALSLAQAHVQIRETSSLGDLISAPHRQPALARLAQDEIEGIGQIAGCLHAGFAEVPPGVRLGWAETLSEFDRPAPLRNLAGLPGWAELTMTLRRTLQEFVDWLFARIDPSQATAVDAVNELVRICLLMAADSPVDRLIPAHLVAPAPAKIGSRFLLALDITRVRRGMTAVVRDAGDRIVSRAIVDDIIDAHAALVITHNLANVATISADMRFHLVSGLG
ncbi:MAG: hypothetical protein JO013_10120 [Alphaproteobacteria bacterium]|nr:hypothetical protein [Alphaproteobacteria bacterium]